MCIRDRDTATAFGAAILAGVGVGLYRDCAEAVDKTVHVTRVHEPDPAAKEAYDAGYRVYRELYESLRALMKKEAHS